MKYLIAEKQALQYYFKVHMDETKLVNSMPDPAYIREYSWGINPPIGQLEVDYIASIKREIGLLVASELVRITPQTPPPPFQLAGF